MADEPALTLSIFEKLTDENPQVKRESLHQRWAGVPELMDSVTTHLEALLNTRRSELDMDPLYKQTNNSVVAYGIMDFTSMSFANPDDREKLRRSIESAVRLFEPRLTRIEVVKPKEWDPRQSGIQFEIQAQLRVGSDLESVKFDALLAKDSRHFRVSSGA